MEMKKSTVSSNALSQSQASVNSNSSKKSAQERNETPPNLPIVKFPTLHPQIQAIMQSL
jgi:hypothetical protein